MASYLRLLAEHHGLQFLGGGELRGHEVLAAAQAVHKYAQTAAIAFLLVDLSAVTTIHIDASEVRRLAEMNIITSSLTPGTRLAVVAHQDWMFGLARMWDAYMDRGHWEIELCRDRATAVSWLGLSFGPNEGAIINTFQGPAA